MTLNTLKEAIQAMLDGKTVIDKDGFEVEFNSQMDCFLYKDKLGTPFYDVSINPHYTLKEEPEYLYEYKGFTFNVKEKRWVASIFISEEKPKNWMSATKTGRKFQLIDGVPVEIRD